MRNHDAFRSRSGATGVIDSQQIALVDSGTNEFACCFLQQAFVIKPAFLRARERDEVPDSAQLRPDTLDGVEIIGMSAHDLCAGVVDQISKIISRQAIVNRDQDCADLRRRVERLELRVSVGRDVSHAVGLSNSKFLQSSRPAIATIKKLFVTQAQIAVDYRFAVFIKLAGTPPKFKRRQWSFHRASV